MTRQQIIETARGWIGTPFQHQGRLWGVGVDCVGLVLCVLKECGLDRLEEYRVYSSQPTGRFVQEECARRLRQKPLAEIEPGDVITLRLPSVPCHLAIVTRLGDSLGMIHAYAGGQRRVVEHILDAKWRRRIEGVFEVPGIQ